MKRHIAIAVLCVLVALACNLTGASPTPTRSPAPPIRVGLVADVAGLEDHGFNTLANKGRTEAQNQLGVRTEVLASKQHLEYVQNLTEFANQGYDFIVAVTMQNPTWKVAKQFTNLRFAIIDGVPENDAGKREDLPNVANLVFREQEAGYLVGVIAGEMLRRKVGRAGDRNIACAMGAIPAPHVERFIAGYQAGLDKYGVRMLLSYSQSFTDAQKGREIGLQHIAQGCSVLFQVAGQSGLGYIQAAKERNVYAIGADVDQGYIAPEAVLTSALKKVDRAVFESIRAVRDGRFRSGDSVFSAENDGVGYGTLHKDVPADVKAAADAALADMKSGRIRPPTEVRK
jgi:basic membrane protein A